MKRTGVWILIALALASSTMAFRSTFEGYLPRRFTRPIFVSEFGSIEFLREVAKRVNQSLPRQIDEETVLQKVTAEEGGLIYSYLLVNVAEAEINREILQGELFPDIRTRTCNAKGFEKLFQSEVEITYYYFAKDGPLVGILTISAKDCGL